MRVIKFRVFNKEEKRMFYTPNLKVTSLDSLSSLPDVCWDCEGYKNNQQNFIIMQYIGLKDKNKKEIYEGDIVKFFKEMDYVVSGCKEIEYANFIVEFEDGAFWLKEIDSDDPEERNNRLVRNGIIDDIHITPTPIAEIIGNIHENPELIGV